MTYSNTYLSVTQTVTAIKHWCFSDLSLTGHPLSCVWFNVDTGISKTDRMHCLLIVSTTFASFGIMYKFYLMKSWCEVCVVVKWKTLQHNKQSFSCPLIDCIAFNSAFFLLPHSHFICLVWFENPIHYSHRTRYGHRRPPYTCKKSCLVCT